VVEELEVIPELVEMAAMILQLLAIMARAAVVPVEALLLVQHMSTTFLVEAAE
jgi:hypothetical protein